MLGRFLDGVAIAESSNGCLRDFEIARTTSSNVSSTFVTGHSECRVSSARMPASGRLP
jgi:hypothetical protein